MPIHFTCPNCGAETDVADNYAGQSGPCAQCGKTITIPPPGAPPGYIPPAKSSSAVPVVVIVLVSVVGVLVVCGGIFVALLLPAIGAAREAARRAACMNNLKQIGLGMQNHEMQHKRFPSAYGAERQDRPKSSWRVHLLPYMENAFLHDQYDFDEAWNSPANLSVADMIPPEYRCRSDPNTSARETSYLAIVGPNTAMPEDGKLSARSDFPDGTSETLMIVGVHNSGIVWTEPRDLDAKTLNYQLNAPGGTGLQGPHPGGINVLMCDGSVHFLNNSIDPKVLKAMTTRDGGDLVDPSPFD